MKPSTAEILREYGPFPGVDRVNGVTYDGQHVWFAAGDKLSSFDPASGKPVRSIDVAAHAGTAFDGQYLFQLAEDRIQKIDPKTGRVLATIPAPSGGGSGLAWAEGALWVGQYRNRKIHQIDPQTGATLRTIESNRFVTGVTWIDGELWHATWEGDESDLRRVDPRTGEVLESLEMPRGVTVSGLESDGGDRFFCGGGSSGKIRTVRRPRRGSAAGSGSRLSSTPRASRRSGSGGKKIEERSMNAKNYTATFSVDQSSEEVFDAINNVRRWWSGEIDGNTDKLGAEFTYRYEDVHRSTQKITELVPGKKVVWHVSDAKINFVKDKAEWNGTDIVFEIAKKGNKTELRFTHVGLVPAIQCTANAQAHGAFISTTVCEA